MAASSAVTPNSVGWYILEGFPWWPVYICDPFKLRPNLYSLGNGHRKILKKARDFPKDYIVVYYFGSHDFSLVSLKKPVLRPWDCPQKDLFVKGHPKHLVKKRQMQEELQEAIREAEDYLSQPEDIRLPQHMVPSDLDPSLEPPPPELVREEVDEAMDDAGDENAEDVEEDTAMDQEDESGYSDTEEAKKSKKKSKKPSKDKKDKKKASSKDKKAKDKKKVSKSKTHSSSSPSADKKHRKSSSKSKDHDKKRKKSEDGDGASPTKVLKQEKHADVKSEPEPQEEKRPATSAEDLSSEELSALLEKEIRWILVNCQFEEMTTKTVRKLLEDRLNMDLHKHKPSIKEGVARVIKSMEDEDAAESNSASNGDATESTAASNGDADIEAETRDTVKDEERSTTDNEAAHAEGTDGVSQLKNQLEDARKKLDLALDQEAKTLDVLASLEKLESVEKEVLAGSALLSKLVALRAHESTAVSKRVAELVKKWDAESLVPAPKQVREEELRDVKAKIEDAETSHEEILVCLDQLAEMPLKISHIRKTGIALAVSKLRQHANDKVSTKANDLRRAWIKLMSTEKSDSSASTLKTLKNLNHILEQHAEGGEGEEGVQSAQLKALEQLQSMSLLTQDIIESKIGVSVSKLRKSGNDQIVSAAIKLRKKWKAEAKAA